MTMVRAGSAWLCALLALGAGAPALAQDKGKAPQIKPPDLDLPKEEVAKRVANHLSTGRRAIAGGRGDPDLAIQEARAALQVDETSVPSMVLLAHGYFIKGFFDKSEAILDIAAKRPDGGRDPQLHFLLAMVYERTDRPEKAETSYQKSLAAKADYKPSLINLGVVYLRNKRYRDAISVFERLGQLGEKTATTLTNLGSAYRGQSVEPGARRSELLIKAESSYKAAIATDQSYRNAYYNLGVLYLDADPFPEPRGGNMDTLKRLSQARTYFAEYRRMPGANLELADEQDETVRKLYEKEERVRERARQRRERDARKKTGGGQ